MEKLYFREMIVDYFESMVDPEKQKELGPTEAFCEWFDDGYFPCNDPKIFNPGVYEKGLRGFEYCFSREELDAMARYHKYFKSIADDFSLDRNWDEITQDPRWQRLTKEAKEALRVFQQSTKT